MNDSSPVAGCPGRVPCEAIAVVLIDDGYDAAGRVEKSKWKRNRQRHVRSDCDVTIGHDDEP